MYRIALFTIVAILAGVYLQSGSQGVLAEEAQEKPGNLLVQLEGKFVGIKATNKRRQSYIFEFQASDQLHGPRQVPTPNKTLVQFELFDGEEARNLLTKLKADPMKELKLKQIVEGLPNSPRFQAVFWVSPGVKNDAFDGSKGQLAAPPVMLRD